MDKIAAASALTLNVGGEEKSLPLDKITPEHFQHLLFKKPYGHCAQESLCTGCRETNLKISDLNLNLRIINNVLSSQMRLTQFQLEHVKHEQERVNGILSTLNAKVEKMLLMKVVNKKKEQKKDAGPPPSMYM